MKSRCFFSVLISLLLAGCATLPREAPMSPAGQTARATQTVWRANALPYAVERLSLPGPVAGVLVKVNLDDPRVRIAVALADDRDPDGDGPCVGQLDTTSNAARKLDVQVALNASFFAVPATRDFEGKRIAYFAGNCGYPVGWHFSDGRLRASPAGNKFRATLIVHEGGRVSIAEDVKQLPADTRFAVSGSALLLAQGKPPVDYVPLAFDQVRHPRSAVGLSADARTLLLLAIDGRQSGHSRGATLAELAALLQNFGADSAINLDGGGSTALVLKDPATGVYAVANQPSDKAALPIPLSVERPVIDIIGIRIAP